MKDKKANLLILCTGFVLYAGIMSLLIWLWNASAKMTVVVYSTSLIVLVISVIIVLLYRRKIANYNKSIENDLSKYELCCALFSSWMINKSKGKMLEVYFIDNNYKSIAIYGLDKLGLCLYFELKESNIEVKYLIDHRVEHFSYLGINIIPPTGNLTPVDAIVVANVEQLDIISLELRKRGKHNILSLADVIGSY